MTDEKAFPRVCGFGSADLGYRGRAAWPGTKETCKTKHAASDQGQSLCAVWAGIRPSRGHHDLHQGRRRSYRRERWSALILCRLVRRKRHPARNATFLPGGDRQPQASRNIKRGTPFSCVNRNHTMQRLCTTIALVLLSGTFALGQTTPNTGGITPNTGGVANPSTPSNSAPLATPPTANPSNPQDLSNRSNPQDLTKSGASNPQDLKRK
jgi:hypothetical protein